MPPRQKPPGLKSIEEIKNPEPKANLLTKKVVKEAKLVKTIDDKYWNRPNIFWTNLTCCGNWKEGNVIIYAGSTENSV